MSTHKSLVLALTSLVAPLALSESPAFADTTNTAQASVGSFSQTVSQPGTVDAGGSATGANNSFGDVMSHVEYGLIRLSGQCVGSLSGIARGIFKDTIVITAPGVATGTLGTVTYGVNLDGSVSASSGSSAATWLLQTDLGGGAFDMNRSGRFNSPDLPPPGYSGDAIGTYSATVSFQFGIGMPLHVELSCGLAAGYSASGPGQAAFGAPFTLGWAGLTNVTAGGSPVNSFTVSSQSGTDWANGKSAAPCPADLNDDGQVDGADLGSLLAAWGGTGAADLNEDGTVDGADLGALLAAWGPCSD